MTMLFGDEYARQRNDNQDKNNEWYTPAKYIEAAREVMQGIDLDPASCALANETVKATQYYSLKNNGLTKDWSGKIWLNPPYGKVNPVPGSVKSYQKIFVQKLLHEYAAGRIEQAILLLLGNSCFAHYFYPLWNHPLCFHDGYISFYKPDGSTDDFGFGTIFIYLGSNEAKFIEVFSQFGRVVRAIDTPKPAQVTQHNLWNNESEKAS